MSGSIFDALTDPGTDALLGLAQGFGQAAMPQRMPVPLGAAFGMGGAGALQGVQTGQALRQAGIKNQQAQIGLDWYRNQMNNAGAPFGAPGGTGGGTPDQDSQYLVSPRMLASMIPMLVGTGQDRGIAPIAGLIQHYAGGPGFALNRQSAGFAVPGGSADPRVIAAQKYAETTGAKTGEAPFASPITYQKPVVDPNTGQVVGTTEVQTPVVDWARNGGRPSVAPGPQSQAAPPAGGALPATTWAQRLMGTENATGNPSAQNPRSTATGNGQFIEGTWLDQIKKMYPAQTANMTDAQILALRSDPIISHQATMNYGAENAPVLNAAGIMPTATSLAAAHKLGPQDAVRVIQASRDAPRTPLSAILSPDVMTANPSFARQTAGTYMFGLAGQFGGAPVDFGRGVPSPAAAPPAGAGQPTPSIATSPLGQVPPIAPPSTGMGGAVKLTPNAQSNVDIAKAWSVPQDLRPGGAMPVPPGVNPAMPQGGVLQAPRETKIVGPNGQEITGQLIHAPPYGDPLAPATFVPATVAQPAAAPSVASPAVGALPGPRADQVPPQGAPQPGGQAVSKLAPDVQQGRNEIVKEFQTKDQDAYESAKNTQAWINQIMHAADVVDKAGALYQTGPFAPTRLALMGNINDVGRTLHLGQPFDPNALASAEELRKATTTAGFELASHYEGHSRQAASTILNATSAVPGEKNSPQGIRLVAAGIGEIAQSAADAHEYRLARFRGADPYGLNPGAAGQTGGQGLTGAVEDFYKKFTPEMYSERAVSTHTPVDIKAGSLQQAQAAYDKYLPGTVIRLNGETNPDGTPKLRLVPPRPNAPPVPQYILNRFGRPNGG